MDNISQENKERIVVWLYPYLIRKMDKMLDVNNMKNKSEFISKAVDFYIGYLGAKDSTTYLSKILVGTVESALKEAERKTSNNIFRLSVELAMMMNILAAGLEIDDAELEKLRARCIKEIRKTKGNITMEQALQYQRGEK